MQDLWDGGRDGEQHEIELLPRHENIRTTNGREREWGELDEISISKKRKVLNEVPKCI